MRSILLILVFVCMPVFAQEDLKAVARGNTTKRHVGAPWSGSAPEFRNLQWVIDK